MKLRIAVQSKGRLNEDTMELLKEAGIKVSPLAVPRRPRVPHRHRYLLGRGE